MAIEQTSGGARPGSEQCLGVDVGAQAGTGALIESGDAGTNGSHQMGLSLPQDMTKILKPLPHGVMDLRHGRDDDGGSLALRFQP